MLALRVLGQRAAVGAVAVITVLLAVALVRQTGRLDLEQVTPPAAAVWATVALHRSQQQLQREAGRLAERARIARDLHDTLAQELAGSRMLLQSAERDWDRRPEAARAQVRAVVEALGTNLAETRSIIGDLTPPALRQDDLETALRVLCARTQAAVGAPCVTFRTRGGPVPVSTDRAAALLRVAQGLLANVRDHARAGKVLVTLARRADGTIALEVRDDGVGFAPGASGAPSAPGRGFGLAAGRDRLGVYGGTLAVRSAPGRGTRALATVPVGSSVSSVPVGAAP
ncbi:sensor histidine kinase [Streptomyces sp. NPDC052236]|uniref:sensor histidine kinase n=1 Tax=Streptomyces sp. NPDC052236 TaxID=3365686 RepID=UPI0037D4BD19